MFIKSVYSIKKLSNNNNDEDDNDNYDNNNDMEKMKESLFKIID